MEKQFAVKTVQHMATYWSILEKARGSKLRLTKFDDEILEHFQRDFPEIDVSQTLNEDEMKSKIGKERWRNFMMAYEKKVEDYNFGTMLRRNPKKEYDEQDTMFCQSLPLHSPVAIDCESSHANAILCDRDCKVSTIALLPLLYVDFL